MLYYVPDIYGKSQKKKLRVRLIIPEDYVLENSEMNQNVYHDVAVRGTNVK